MDQTVTAASRTEELKELLGRGVDIFTSDPWAPDFKERIVKPEIKQLPIGTSGYKETYADSFLSLSHKIAVDAGLEGSYAGVTASVKSKFTHSVQQSEKTHFLKIAFNTLGSSLVVDGGREKLKRMLDPDFKASLNGNETDPEEIFKDYGIHVVTKIKIGGRAEYYCQSSKTSTMTEHEFLVAAKVKYQSLGGDTAESAGAGGSAKATTTVTTTDTSKTTNIASNDSIDAVGGSAEAAVKINDKNGWATWAAAADRIPAFLGFGERDGLLPVWELADSPARKERIQKAYWTKAALALKTHILSATSAVASHPDISLTVPKGYKILCGGARDNWKTQGNLLTASFPQSNNTWRACGKDHEISEPASITVSAVVIYDPDDIWDVKIFTKTSGPAVNHPFQEVSVSNDYVMVGGGAQCHWTGAGTLLFESYPMDGTTWRAKAKDHGIGAPSTITAYAIGLKCNNVDGIEVDSEIVSSQSYSSNRPAATAAPPSGHVMTGGGAAVKFGGPGLLLYASCPKNDAAWEAEAKDHKYGDSGTITTYCIGVKVGED